MLHNFSAHHNVEGLFSQISHEIFVSRENFEAPAGIGQARHRNALFAQIDSYHLAAASKKFTAGEAVAATDVQDTCSGTERFGELEHLRHEMPMHMRLVRIGKPVFLVFRSHPR